MSIFIVLLVVIIIMAATYRPQKNKLYRDPQVQMNYIEIDEFDGGGMMRRPADGKCPCAPAGLPDASGTVTSPVVSPVAPALSASRMRTRCARARCNGGARYNGRRRYSMRADGEIVDENGMPVDPDVFPGNLPIDPDVFPGVLPVVDPDVFPGNLPIDPNVFPGVLPVDPGVLPIDPDVFPGILPVDPGVLPIDPDVFPGILPVDPGVLPIDPGMYPGVLPVMPVDDGGGGTVDILPSEDDAAIALNMVFPTMVFIYMDGCSFCDKAKPDYVQLARENPGVHMAAINARRAHRLSTANQIDGFPAFLTNFGPHRKIVGFKPKGTMQRVLHAARVSPGRARLVVSPVPMHSAARGAAARGRGGSVKEVTEAAAAALLANPSSKPVIVFLYATWCGFCKKMKPVYESLASKFPGVQMVMVNADKAPKLVSDNKITGYPSFLRNFGHKSSVGTAAKGNLIKDVGYKAPAEFASILALARSH
jgi:thiol-disulfide isomerase/thioredoxin